MACVAFRLATLGFCFTAAAAATTKTQTLILKVVRIFLLGVLSAPATIHQHTPTAPPATLDGGPPPPPPAGLEVSGGSTCSTETTAETRASPEESTLEGGALSPSGSGDRGVGIGGASAIASGPGLGERGRRVWACLPADVTAAVLGAVELPDLQVGKSVECCRAGGGGEFVVPGVRKYVCMSRGVVALFGVGVQRLEPFDSMYTKYGITPTHAFLLKR